MILVGQLDSPYVRRVAVTLRHYGLPFTRSPLSVFSDAEEMRRINPLGRVPSLVLDDGEVLVDSAAIIDHLDQLAGPERALTPAAGPERRRCLRLVALATGAIDKAMLVAYERLRRPPERQFEPWVERCRVQAETALGALDAVAPSPWLLGARFSQADVTVAAMVGYVRTAPDDLLPVGRYPNLDRLSDACEALPEFVESHPSIDAGLGAPVRGL